MKTQLKRLSKSTISVLLAVCLLFSCMTVGLIATSAAQDGSEAIGENNAFTKGSTIYIDIGDTWYNNYPNTNVPYAFFSYSSSDANTTSYQFDRQALTQVSGSIFSITVPNRDYMRVIRIQRCNASDTSTVWDSVTTSKDAAGSNNLFTISSWHDDGGWSTYTPLATPTTMTATVSHSKSGGARIVSGNGTVSVDGGTASSTTATKTVERGSSVTFAATPDSGYSFAGWYSDEACTTRLSTSTSYTVTASSDTTVYAAFNKEHYYLVGKFYQANLAKERIENNDSTSFAFTQSPSDPALYTYTDDFMFKYDSASSQYRLQYISIGYGGTNAYNTSSAGAASGTPASGKTQTNAHNDGVNKWTCGDLSTPSYPPSDLNNCYKTVTFTWNAITETLSWTITDIDLTQYTAMYINCGSTWTWDHLYLANYQGDLNTIFIPGTPYIIDSGVTYNVILVKNSTIGDKTLGFKYQKAVDSGSGDQSGEFTVTTGSTSKSDLTSNNWDPDESYTPPGVVYDRYYLAGQYSDGSTQFFGGQWNTTNNELTRNGANYTKTFTTNIPAGTIQFKVVKDGAWENGSWPAENQSYVIRENATSVTFTFDPSTHTTTVTQTNSGGGGSSGSWVPGDKYTSTGTNANQRVADIPNIGTTSSTYKYVWADNDNGPGKSGTTAISLVQNASSGNIGYWAEVSEQTLSGSNFFFALSNNNNNSGIRGNKEETINCVVPSGGSTTSSGDEVSIYNSNHEQVFKVGRQERSEVTGSAYFIKIVGVDTSKVSAIGVMAYYNGSGAVDYQIYFKEKGATPVVETKVVDICAKDGTLRDDTFNRFARLATTTIDSSDAACFEYTDENGVTYSSISDYNTAKDPDIVITRESYGGTDAGYTKMTNVPVGAKVKIKTTLSSNSSAQGSFDNKAFKETHYVKGYSFNGVTYQINEWESDGVYEEIWTVRAVNTTYKDSNDVLQNATTGGKVVEVTPIYYMKDNTNCKTFYIDGYDGTVQNAWGNMLAVYPYYEGKSNKDNAFGGYPGQPMLLWGGKYQMEIPLTVDGTASGASVKGLTLHNAYWDLLHRSIDIRCNARNHAQTYDYDDFYKLYKEKNPDTIIFDFKYRTAEDNYLDGYEYTRYTFADGTTKQASDFTGDGHNGVEIVTDYFGRQVDAFGNLIADANKSRYGEDNGSGGTVGQSNEILFVSTGYKDTYVGEYATIWAVYQSNGTFIGYISSSMLYLNNIDRRLQYTGGDSTASGRMSWSNFISTYNTLKSSYTGVPALIVYDREIWNDSKDKANRSDGKWYYSNKSDKISANIKIQYGAYSLFEAPDHSVSSDAWNDDPFNQSKTGVGGYNNIGTNTGCSAYFTNTTPNLNGKVASGEQFADSTKKFTFQAVPSGSYMFAGWVRYSNGKYYEITENEIGESPMSSNDVYIARFVTAKTGTLTVQHVVEQTNDFNGTGTPSLTVTVNNGNDTVQTFTNSTPGEKLDISKWIDARNATYTIDISMTTTPTNESFMKNIASSSGNYAASPNTWNESYDKTNSSGANTDAQTATVARFTVQQILDSGITSLRYVSHLMKPVYTYQYEIVYTYTSRFWGTQSYTQSGTCDEGDFTGSKTTAKLTTDFIIGKTPYEKSFRQQIDWNYTTTAVPAASGTGNVGASAMENNVATDQGSNTYKMTAHVYASKTVNDKVTAEFVLPYKYNEKAQGYTVKDTDVYNSSGTKSGTSYLYDSGNESVTLSTKAYSLFTYDDEYHTGSDDVKASSLPLMEAAPYLMTNLGDNDYHYKLTDNMRYYTGKSFKVGDTTYYLSQDDVPQNPGTYKVLTASDSVNFTKIKYAGTDKTTTYHFAVEDTSGGAKGEYGYKVYFFSYVADEFGNYIDNEGHSVEEPIFNGQYCVYSVGREKDGIIEGKGSKKYFTRWDIYNTKGDFVASCYNRRFNYSGYDNYVVRPIYESDTENSYASSTGDGYKSQITFLDDSRNQWNNGASGDYNRVTNLSDANYAGDKIFTDFAITYAYEGRNINTVSSDEAKIRVGMVIEKLDALDTVGSTTISDASYYANKYKGDTDWEALSTALAGGTSLTTAVRSAGGASSAGHSCFNSKIASNYDETGYTRFGNPAPGAISGQESVVDNFNRLQWFYTFNNSTKTTAGADTVEGTMKNYAFRAISYIIVEKNGTKTATLTDTPVYFTIYDTATRAHN